MGKRNKPPISKAPLNIDYATLKKQILGVMSVNPNQGLNYKQISKQLLIGDKEQRKVVYHALEELLNSGDLEALDKGKYRIKRKFGYVIGRVELTESGNARIISDDFKEEIQVGLRGLHHAMKGDLVKVRVMPKKRFHYLEGEVVEIIERVKSQFVGIIQEMKNFAFLVPDNRRIGFDLFIPRESMKKAKHGMKVVGEITDWPKHAKNPFGKVTKILGYPGEHNAEINAIMEEFELPYEFSKEVIAESEQIAEASSSEEISKRRDFRKITTFTIDPADAKDFDDALSLQKLPNGNWEIGVHIADVTHYVKKRTLLDEDAYNRATSVYLVDRVVPMLPERLSNELCSLRPNEEKLTFSAVFEMDDNANLINEWFGRTIIYSDKRFSYEEAQMIIDTEEGDLADEIKVLHRLAQILRNERFKSGSISFERDEVKFNLDDKGKPLGVFFKQHGTSNELIEEFMLMANKRVANLIGNKKGGGTASTFVYRIHDLPDPEKLQNFNQFIRKFGYSIKQGGTKQTSQSINELLAKVQGTKEQHLIETLAVRSMAKAVYSTHNLGHYGLGFEYYTHFTSPIRRFPDMMVHRMLADYLEGGSSKNQKNYEEYCKHCSDMEKRATDAERASIKYKQVEFMSDHIGELFDGIISGVTEWGIYVELNENKCEGMVPIRDLDDDFYEYDEENYCLKGMQAGHIYQLGDPVKVVIAKANLLKKQLDFKIVEREEKG